MVESKTGGRQVQVRLPDEAIEKLDAWADRLRASGAPGTSGVTRSDLIREAVLKALLEDEKSKRTKR